MEMEAVPMQALLARSVEGIKSMAQNKKVNLNLHCADIFPSVWGDASRLQQVVDNLISNAIKFTDANGTIEVTGEDKGDCVKISVKDNGIGMAPADQEKVFDMFYQADASMRRSAGGAGLAALLP